MLAISDFKELINRWRVTYLSACDVAEGKDGRTNTTRCRSMQYPTVQVFQLDELIDFHV